MATKQTTTIKKVTTVFSNMISVRVNEINHLAEGQYQLNCTHFGYGNKSFAFDVITGGQNPPGMGDYVLLIDYVPQNRLEDGSHCHRLILTGRSQIVSTNKDTVVNTFIANGRLGANADHRSGDDWKSTSYSCYVSYWDTHSKSVKDFALNVSHWGVHIPNLNSGNGVMFKGSLTSNTSKEGKDYFNIGAAETNYGSQKK